MLGFAFGYLFFGIGYLVTHLLPGDAFWTFHTTQLFYSVGVTFFAASTCERVGQRIHLPTILGIYAISAVILAFAISFGNDAGPRLILINIGYGSMFLVNLVTLLQAQRRDWIDQAIIVVTAFQAAAVPLLNSRDSTKRTLFSRTLPEAWWTWEMDVFALPMPRDNRSAWNPLLTARAAEDDWKNVPMKTGKISSTK